MIDFTDLGLSTCQVGDRLVMPTDMIDGGTTRWRAGDEATVTFVDPDAAIAWIQIHPVRSDQSEYAAGWGSPS